MPLVGNPAWMAFLVSNGGFTNNPTSTSNPTCWMTVVLRNLVDISWDLWEHQNSILHSHPSVTKRKIGQTLDQQIQAQFAISPHMMASPHWLSDRPIQHILWLDLHSKQQSLQLAKADHHARHAPMSGKCKQGTSCAITPYAPLALPSGSSRVDPSDLARSPGWNQSDCIV